MTIEEKKELVKKIRKNLFGRTNKKASEKFTVVEIIGNTLRVTHVGKDHHTESDISENLEKLKLPTIECLKENFEVVKETGKPDNFYVIDFRIRAKGPSKIIPAKKYDNIPNRVSLLR